MIRLALVVALSLAAPALAQPRPGAWQAPDQRVQIVDYDPDRVVVVRGALGYQLMLEFSPNERIENVSIGDAIGWQVTPNKRANILFLKPIDGSATNLTVITDARRYLLDLRVAAKGSRTPPPYTVRYIYPAPAVATLIATPEPEPQVVNDDYVITGSAINTPTRTFDDGQMTYFEWPADGPVPGIFAVGPDGAESIVNYTVRGRYIVVQQIAPRFALRNGKQVATVINGAHPAVLAQRKSR